ncbi:MAG: ATP-binding cassette domain-containing protein [Eubacterium sp.]|nr:ATP-binding cassette domain-containing protein [Oscillospiraceae bacterium]MDD6356376.1 ATP-binding cassette domain-containing protein [Oscillospiraceae bacterium]MDY4608142.1 ATP-binding cassette domain-containing protein [Eubacterium sp.]
MLDVKNLSKTFAPGTVNEHKALDNINLHLDDGDFVTIVGSNGAGKSTLFNMLCGTYTQDRGTILLDDLDISNMPEHKRAKYIGRVFQDPMKGTAPNMTIEENLALAYSRAGSSYLSLAVSNKKKKMFAEKLAAFDMGLEDRMKTKIGLLSGGQRQVVTLLMCTIVTPKLLLLDEHTAALDPMTANKVMEITNNIVKENNITTLMITHNMTQALKTGNRTVMMDSGNIIIDLSQKEREGMTVPDLLELYKNKENKDFDNDRILLQK